MTPGPPRRESILAALRAAITLDAPYGPPGGLPGRVPDRPRQGLPVIDGGSGAGRDRDQSGCAAAYTPHLKGTVEKVNGAAGQMFFAGLPPVHGAGRGWRTAPPTPMRRR
jgi:putative transposase